MSDKGHVRSDRVLAIDTPELIWVKDAGQVLVIHTTRNLVWALEGLEAAVWDWLNLGYGRSETVHLISLISGITEDQASATLVEIMHRWQDAGLVRSAGDDSGEPGDQRSL